MTASTAPAVTTAVQRIVRAMDPERVLLFGSHANQTADPASDVDLLIVLSEDTQSGEELRRARQLVAQCFPPIDVVVCTAEQAAQTDASNFYFLQAALERGIVLYEKRGEMPLRDRASLSIGATKIHDGRETG